jgi:hypothetical protein
MRLCIALVRELLSACDRSSLSPRAKHPRQGVPTAPPQPVLRLRGRGDVIKGPVARCRAAHALRPCVPRMYHVRLPVL